MPKIEDLTDKELLKEWHKWDTKIKNATSWGAALSAAYEFRSDCEREVRQRNLQLESKK